MPKIKVASFDFDGTLADAYIKQSRRVSVNFTLQKLGHKKPFI